VSPHLGDRVETNLIISSGELPGEASGAKPPANVLVALPLGGRIKVDPWNDQLMMLKAKPVRAVAEDEKKPFEITPFAFYLTRRGENPSTEASGAAAAKLEIDGKP